MEKVRIGLIGLGFMGTTHFGIYRDLAAAEVVADWQSRQLAGVSAAADRPAAERIL